MNSTSPGRVDVDALDRLELLNRFLKAVDNLLLALGGLAIYSAPSLASGAIDRVIRVLNEILNNKLVFNVRTLIFKILKYIIILLSARETS